jgi:hypothetical protein
MKDSESETLKTFLQNEVSGDLGISRAVTISIFISSMQIPLPSSSLAECYRVYRCCLSLLFPIRLFKNMPLLGLIKF